MVHRHFIRAGMHGNGNLFDLQAITMHQNNKICIRVVRGIVVACRKMYGLPFKSLEA